MRIRKTERHKEGGEIEAVAGEIKETFLRLSCMLIITYKIHTCFSHTLLIHNITRENIK